jgi:hypothetical protein
LPEAHWPVSRLVRRGPPRLTGAGPHVPKQIRLRELSLPIRERSRRRGEELKLKLPSALVSLVPGAAREVHHGPRPSPGPAGEARVSWPAARAGPGRPGGPLEGDGGRAAGPPGSALAKARSKWPAAWRSESHRDPRAPGPRTRVHTHPLLASGTPAALSRTVATMKARAPYVQRRKVTRKAPSRISTYRSRRL